MKEYTILAALFTFITIHLDRLTGTALLKRKEFGVFLLCIFLLKLIVNGFLTGAKVVIYNPQTYLGFRLFTIPLEDFLFGFSMVTTSIILWEYFTKRR